jgi:DNA-binding transcriptional ArsR family regulator
MAFLMFAVLVVSAPAAAADQEATWVRTTPGVWMLEDSDGLLHEPQPQAGLFLSPVEGRTIGVALAGALEGTWLIEDIWSTGLGSQNNEESGQEMEQGITPISIPALPWAPAFMAMILLSLALVSAGDEPTRAKMVRSMGRFSQLRVTEGTGTLAGTYQRGRLEGFLTAHPGCHLSGIIRALEMGNHQAVHHLRILENEGNVWCRRDGRLLRYYTSAVDRAAETSNLPRPVDASQLSDVALMVLRSIAEQEDGETPPTQRELASTIGTSQQLVGHHLKRLESQGLITRRRRGLRTNRELTDEGMRLWATLVEPLSLRP